MRADARVDDVDAAPRDARSSRARRRPPRPSPARRALTMMLRSVDRALLHLREELLEGDALLRAPRELLRAQRAGARRPARSGAPGARSRRPAPCSPAARRLVEAEDLDRRAGPGLLDAARRGSRRARAPCPRRRRRRSRRRRWSVPRCTSIVATGPRPTSSRLSMIGPEASAFGFAVSSSSASATSRICSSEVVEPLAGLRRDVGELRRAAPLLRLEPVLDELLPHARSGSRRACRSC